ncbi:MAG: SIR2 family NAD-dependent protein deacylase [Nitrosopumilus sp.]
MFESIERNIREIKKIVVVTGAGISQESGVPTFRGKDGLWKNHDVMKLATIDAFYDDPKLVWEWYNERRRNVIGAVPNHGHKAIVDLEKYAEVIVLTQNIDGLHQKAGSVKVLELHGSIVKIKCSVCSFKSEIKTHFDQIPPVCKCENILRPDVVWFGEPLPQDVWQKAITYASECDLMIIAGTSLVVSPANSLPIYAKQNKATLLEINPEETELSSEMDIIIRNTSAITLPKLVRIFKENY